MEVAPADGDIVDYRLEGRTQSSSLLPSDVDHPARGPDGAYTVTKVILGGPSKSVPLSLCVYTKIEVTQSAAREVFISL